MRVDTDLTRHCRCPGGHGDVLPIGMRYICGRCLEPIRNMNTVVNGDERLPVDLHTVIYDYLARHNKFPDFLLLGHIEMRALRHAMGDAFFRIDYPSGKQTFESVEILPVDTPTLMHATSVGD